MRRLAPSVVLAVLALGVAACTGAGNPVAKAARSPHRAAVRIVAHAAVVVGTRAEALSVGNEMLAKVTPPPGSRPAPLSRLGAQLSGHVEGISRPWLVVPYRAYLLPMRARAAARYLFTHVPHGFGFVGSWQDQGGINGYQTGALPAGIEGRSLYIDLMPGPAGNAVMLEYAIVYWYPPRTPAERLVASRFRAIRISGMEKGSPTTTTTSRHLIDAVVSAVDQMALFPNEGLLCAPPGPGPTFNLELVPAAPTQPEVMLGSSGCGGDYFEVGGKPQPALIDPHNAIGNIVSAYLGT
jgi:hypothetical protein